MKDLIMITQIQVTCDYCKCSFYRKPREVKRSILHFCSKDCFKQYNSMFIKKVAHFNCGLCNKQCTVQKNRVRKTKSGLNFCSYKCSYTYHKKFNVNSQRSKIEIKFAEEIQKIFPNLEFIFNNSDIIGYELDIYIPELKIAIEWNGVVHYQPIYGEEKLEKIQHRDYQKQLLCQKYGIELIIITDTKSNLATLNEAIDYSKRIITMKMQMPGIEPGSIKIN